MENYYYHYNYGPAAGDNTYTYSRQSQQAHTYSQAKQELTHYSYSHLNPAEYTAKVFFLNLTIIVLSALGVFAGIFSIARMFAVASAVNLFFFLSVMTALYIGTAVCVLFVLSIVVHRSLKIKYDSMVIKNNNLVYTGKWFHLFSSFVCWTLYTLLTFGLFLPFIRYAMLKWTGKNIALAGDTDRRSKFCGSFFGYIKVTLIWLLLSCTIILLPAAFAYRARWELDHLVVSGCHVSYYSKKSNLVARHYLWFFLTIITAGFYLIFKPYEELKYTTEKLAFNNSKHQKAKLSDPDMIFYAE